jgi:hypothetical protein
MRCDSDLGVLAESAWIEIDQASAAKIGENALRHEEGHGGYEEAHCDGSHRAEDGTNRAFDEPPSHRRSEHGSQSGHDAANRQNDDSA